MATQQSIAVCDEPDNSLIGSIARRRKALTVEELADLLNCSDRSIYDLVKEERIPYFRVRTSIRFDPWAIAEWLRGNGNPLTSQTSRH